MVVKVPETGNTLFIGQVINAPITPLDEFCPEVIAVPEFDVPAFPSYVRDAPGCMVELTPFAVIEMGV